MPIQFSPVPLLNAGIKPKNIDAVTCGAEGQLTQPHRFRRRQRRDPFAVRHGAKGDLARQIRVGKETTVARKGRAGAAALIRFGRPATLGYPRSGVPEHILVARSRDEPAAISARFAGDVESDSQTSHARAGLRIPKPQIRREVVRRDTPFAAGHEAIADQWKIFRQHFRACWIAIRPKPNSRRDTLVLGLPAIFGDDERTFVRRETQHHIMRFGTDSLWRCQLKFRSLRLRIENFFQFGLHDTEARSAVEQRLAVGMEKCHDPPGLRGQWLDAGFFASRSVPKMNSVSGGRGENGSIRAETAAECVFFRRAHRAPFAERGGRRYFRERQFLVRGRKSQTPPVRRKSQRQCRAIAEHAEATRFNRSPNQPVIPRHAYEGIMRRMKREPFRLPFMLSEGGLDDAVGSVDQPNTELWVAFALLLSAIVTDAKM